jgi:hypothetical protein
MDILSSVLWTFIRVVSYHYFSNRYSPSTHLGQLQVEERLPPQERPALGMLGASYLTRSTG